MLLLPHVTPDMLHVNYWLARLPDPDRVLVDPDPIAALNAAVPAITGLADVLDWPDTLPAADVLALIATDPPGSARYAVDGSPLGDAFWGRVRDSMALDALHNAGRVAVRFAVAVRRTGVRTLPTAAPALREPDNLPLDRLQETTIDVGWPLAVLHSTRDADWAFAITPGYAGWLRVADIAFTSRATVRGFASGEPFLRAVGAWADVALADGAHVTCQMGTRLPLLDSGQIVIPRRRANGDLVTVPGIIRHDDPNWHAGDLPLTARTVIMAAFRTLGEPYAWGGMRLGRAARDCSRLARDAYATAGVLLPRNSDQQEGVGQTAAVFAAGEDNTSRLAKLADLPAGALLFLPGHVMIHLGLVEGIPYAIHDLWGYADPAGQTIPAEQVVVSALPVEASAGGNFTLLERLTRAQVVAGGEA